MNKLLAKELLASAQLIKIHEGVLQPYDVKGIHTFRPLYRDEASHIEWSIAHSQTDWGDRIYVIFPGSNDRDDWFKNLQFNLLEWAYRRDPSFLAQGLDDLLALFEWSEMVVPHEDKQTDVHSWSNQQVHAGFMAAYNSLDGKLMALHDAMLKYPNAAVVGVGHSLGSAILRLLFLDAHFNELFKKDPLLHLFGAPRMGNQHFADALTRRLSYIIRVVNGYDLVSRLPMPITTGYRHDAPETHIGARRFLRWYYRDDVRDHYLESYIATLSQMV